MAYVEQLSAPARRYPEPAMENRRIYLQPIKIPPSPAQLSPRELTLSELLQGEGPPPAFLQPQVTLSGPSAYSASSHSCRTGSSGGYSAIFKTFVDVEAERHSNAMTVPPQNPGHDLDRRNSTPEKAAAEALTSMAGPIVRDIWKAASRGSAGMIVNHSVDQGCGTPVTMVNAQVNRRDISQGVRQQEDLTRHHSFSLPSANQLYQSRAVQIPTPRTHLELPHPSRDSSVQTMDMATDDASQAESSTAATSRNHSNTTTPARRPSSTPAATLPKNKRRKTVKKAAPARPAAARKAAPASPPTQSRVPAHWTCFFSRDCELEKIPRKGMSHFFGRNKTATALVPDDAWYIVCRKHYQRCRYVGQVKNTYWRNQAMMIHAQVDRMAQFMGTIEWVIQYQVKLTKALTKHESAPESMEVAAARVLLPYCGHGKSTQQVHDFVKRMESMCQDGELHQFIAVEFLPVKWGVHQKDYHR